MCKKLIISSLQKSKLNVSYLKEQIVEYKSVLYYELFYCNMEIHDHV